MARKKETHRYKRIIRTLKSEVGGWWNKNWGGPFQAAGLPDIIGCVQGLFFAFEVKNPGNKASDIQIETLKDIQEQGGAVALIIYEPQEAVDAVRKAIQEAGRLSAGNRKRGLS